MSKKKYEKPSLKKISVAMSYGDARNLCVQGWGADMIRPLAACESGDGVAPNACTGGQSQVSGAVCNTGTSTVGAQQCSGGGSVT
jgi:hypothetical protein